MDIAFRIVFHCDNNLELKIKRWLLAAILNYNEAQRRGWSPRITMENKEEGEHLELQWSTKKKEEGEHL